MWKEGQSGLGKNIGQRVVSKCIVHHLRFFPFSFYYHLPLLHCFTLLLIIKLFSSQHTSFALIVLAIPLQWVGKKEIELVAAWCLISSWA